MINMFFILLVSGLCNESGLFRFQLVNNYRRRKKVPVQLAGKLSPTKNLFLFSITRRIVEIKNVSHKITKICYLRAIKSLNDLMLINASSIGQCVTSQIGVSVASEASPLKPGEETVLIGRQLLARNPF